jgi:Domain of unknown function (DUF4260)
MVDGLMRRQLQLEGAAIFFGALVMQYWTGYAWIPFLVLFFAPDLSMIGYFLGPRVGAICYNVAHNLALPIILYIASWYISLPAFDITGQYIAVVWIAHVGFDRMLGYGLKYASGFKDTHLGRL